MIHKEQTVISRLLRPNTESHVPACVWIEPVGPDLLVHLLVHLEVSRARIVKRLRVLCHMVQGCVGIFVRVKGAHRVRRVRSAGIQIGLLLVNLRQVRIDQRVELVELLEPVDPDKLVHIHCVLLLAASKHLLHCLHGKLLLLGANGAFILALILIVALEFYLLLEISWYL